MLFKSLMKRNRNTTQKNVVSFEISQAFSDFIVSSVDFLARPCIRTNVGSLFCFDQTTLSLDHVFCNIWEIYNLPAKSLVGSVLSINHNAEAESLVNLTRTFINPISTFHLQILACWIFWVSIPYLCSEIQSHTLRAGNTSACIVISFQLTNIIKRKLNVLVKSTTLQVATKFISTKDLLNIQVNEVADILTNQSFKPQNMLPSWVVTSEIVAKQSHTFTKNNFSSWCGCWKLKKQHMLASKYFWSYLLHIFSQFSVASFPLMHSMCAFAVHSCCGLCTIQTFAHTDSTASAIKEKNSDTNPQFAYRWGISLTNITEYFSFAAH